MKGEREPQVSLANGKCQNQFSQVTVERKSPAHKWHCLLYGVLNVVLVIILIILITTLSSSGNQTGCREQGKTPISEKPEGQPREGEACVPCTMLPPHLRENGCCSGEDIPLKDLVNAYVDRKMVGRLQADEASVRGTDLHAKMCENALKSAKILEWAKLYDGSDNKTHPRIKESGYYFVSTDVSFDFTKPEMNTTTNASFSVMRWEKATGQTSRLFLSHSVPICVKDHQRKSSDCIVPNEVGGIKYLEEGDLLFVETDRPEGVCPSSTSFGFQMISPGPLEKKSS